MFNYMVINSFSLLILALIFINLQKNPVKMSFDNRIFLAMVLSTAAMLILDSLMVAANEQSGSLAALFIASVTFLYYIINPLPPFLWAVYALFHIDGDDERIKRMIPLLALPFAVNAIAAVISLFTDFTFTIDQNNIYHRGKFFIILAVCCFAYLVYTFYIVLRNKKFISKQNFTPMIFFALPPTFGGIFQMIYFGTNTLWPSVTFSVLFIYTNMQNLQIQTDYLTGLFNRRQFDKQLSYRIAHRSSKYLLAGLMIDLNDFKDINDIYGHNIGDMALEDTAAILKQSFKKEDFISRYGGDEFAVLLHIKTRDALDLAVAGLLGNFKRFNTLKKYPFDLSVSIGSGIFEDSANDSMEEFINKIDTRMYIEKKKLKLDD